VLDVFIFANLRLRMQVAFHSALDVRHVLERFGKFLFLLDAMGTPIGTVHLDATLAQAAREGIVLMLTAVT